MSRTIYEIMLEMCSEKDWQCPNDDTDWMKEVAKRRGSENSNLEDRSVLAIMPKLIMEGKMKYTPNKGCQGIPNHKRPNDGQIQPQINQIWENS